MATMAMNSAVRSRNGSGASKGETKVSRKATVGNIPNSNQRVSHFAISTQRPVIAQHFVPGACAGNLTYLAMPGAEAKNSPVQRQSP